MKKNNFLSILTIVCFASILFIPIGLVLMWFSTKWKTKLKIILTTAGTILYAGLLALLLWFLLSPSVKQEDFTANFTTEQGQSVFQDSTYSDKKALLPQGENSKSNKKDKNKSNVSDNSKSKSLGKGPGSGSARWLFPILFFLFMLILILWTNWKAARKKVGYENPYVDTDQYKLPLKPDSKMPMVHFLKLQTEPDEKILFATETTQKDNEGDFVVTSKRVAQFTKTENWEIPLQELDAVASVSNSAFMITTNGQRKYYVLLNESQLKYALAVVRWAYAKHEEFLHNQ
ncbi:MAG: hypothetical protein MJ162_06205 [Treponema sp.]|nr:hypothetical protein [Treponema sp.]